MKILQRILATAISIAAILILLIFCVLTTALASCKGGVNTQGGNVAGEQKIEETNEELLELFSKMQSEADSSKKINFTIQYQSEHLSFKDSGEYADSFWFASSVLPLMPMRYSYSVSAVRPRMSHLK